MVEDWHVRSGPSDADQELIARVEAEEGILVTPTQLERWRMRGLLPRARLLREGFGGTRALPHDEEVVGAAAVLGDVSARSRPWQYSALTLFDEGHSLSSQALRDAATFLVELQVKPMRKAWAKAEIAAAPAEDPDEELAEIGERAARLVPRTAWKVVHDEVRMAHRHVSPTERREYADRAMTWRTVDLNVPERMTEGQRNLARHGVDEPMSVLTDLGVLPLPSERLMVSRTLSWAEADIYREFAYLTIEEQPDPNKFPTPFVLMTWLVTHQRHNIQPETLDRPLPQGHLDQERLRLEKLYDGRSGGPDIDRDAKTP